MRWRGQMQFLGPLSLMAFAIILALLQNAAAFRLNDRLDALIFDAGQYFQSCRWLVLRIMQPPGLALPSDGELAKALLLDGPVLPVLVAVPHLIARLVPTITEWKNLIYLECFLHGVSTLCVFFLGRYLNAGKVFPYVVAFLWAIYPGAVVGTQRFLTEIPSLVFFLLYAVALASSFRGRLSVKWLLAGLLAAIVFMSRAALAPGAFLLGLIAFILNLRQRGWREMVKASACFVAGGAAIVLLWATYTQQTLGHAYLCPQRAPAYNLFAGWDFPLDGFGSCPARSADYFAQSPNMAGALIHLWWTRPSESLQLGMRKLLRLYYLPWNDFRRNMLGVPYQVEVAWHQIFVLLALSAAFYIAVRPENLKGLNREGLFVVLACLAAWLGHLIYLFFEATPRYGFTSMPFLILLACYFVAILTRAHLTGTMLRKLAPPTVLLVVLVNPGLFHGLLLLLNGRPGIIFYEIAFAAVFIFWASAVFSLSKVALPRVGSRIPGLALLTSLGVLLCAGYLLECQTQLRQSAWTCRLSPQDMAVRVVDGKMNAERAMLFADTDRGGEELKAYVNGKKVNANFHAVYRFYAHHYEMMTWLELFEGIFRRPPGDFRQWRCVEMETFGELR